MRILALDIGEVRVGVAVSDPAERVASPVCVLPANEVLGNAKSFRTLPEGHTAHPSREAKRSLREQGMSERDMRGKVDMVAASLFLQSWLDERAAKEEAER